jgi:hypothetical protein
MVKHLASRLNTANEASGSIGAKRFMVLTSFALVVWGIAYVVSVAFNPIKYDLEGIWTQRGDCNVEQFCPGITEYHKLDMFQRLSRISGG